MLYPLRYCQVSLLFADGVVLIDPEYFQKDSKKDRKGGYIHTRIFLTMTLHCLNPSICSDTCWISLWS